MSKNITEAFAERGYKEYDAFVSVIKDTIAPTDNALAYKVEDDVNAMLSEMFTKIENKYIYEERKAYLVGAIKNAILLRGTLSPIKATEDNIYPTYCGNIRHEHVSEVYLDDDGVVVVSTYHTEGGEDKYDVFRCDEFANDEIDTIARIVGVSIEVGKTGHSNMVFNHKFFVSASQEWKETIMEYYAKASFNYVIIERGQVITWSDGNPVIYGDKCDALSEIEQWDSISGISIITEKEFIDTYCYAELCEELKREEDERKAEEEEETIMDAYNGHNEALVDKINDAWRKNREMFAPILKALYARDIDEITNHDAFKEPKWEATDEYVEGIDNHDWRPYLRMVLNSMEKEWDFWAYSYLTSIADDADLICILNYLHVEV